MSVRISIEFPSQQDFHLVRLLLQRLGLPYQREYSDPGPEDHWLNTLNLVQEPAPVTYAEHLGAKLVPGTSPATPPPACYGAWEDKHEDLEQLLGMLTP